MQAGKCFDEFIKQDLFPAVKVVHCGVPFSHKKVSNISASEFGAMQQQISSFMKTCDKFEMTLHADVWADPWERHWFWCNCPIAKRDDEAGLRQSRDGFGNVDSWTDPLGSVSAHQAQTAATCWKSFL